MTKEELEKIIKNDPGFRRTESEDPPTEEEDIPPLGSSETPGSDTAETTVLGAEDTEPLVPPLGEDDPDIIDLDVTDTGSHEEEEEADDEESGDDTVYESDDFSSNAPTAPTFTVFDDTGEMTNGNKPISFEKGMLEALSFLGSTIGTMFNSVNKMIMGIFQKPIYSCKTFSSALMEWGNNASKRIDDLFKKHGVNPADLKAYHNTLAGKIFKLDMADMTAGQEAFMKQMTANLSMVKAMDVYQLVTKMKDLEDLRYMGVKIGDESFAGLGTDGNPLKGGADALGTEDLSRLVMGDKTCGQKYTQVKVRKADGSLRDVTDSDIRKLKAYITEYKDASKAVEKYCKIEADSAKAQVEREAWLKKMEEKNLQRHISQAYEDERTGMTMAQKLACSMGLYDERGYFSYKFRENEKGICGKVADAVSKMLDEEKVILNDGHHDDEKQYLNNLSQLCAYVEAINKERQKRVNGLYDQKHSDQLRDMLYAYLGSDDVAARIGKKRLEFKYKDDTHAAGKVNVTKYKVTGNYSMDTERLLDFARYGRGVKEWDAGREAMLDRSVGGRLGADTGAKLVMFSGGLRDKNGISYSARMIDGIKELGDSNLERPEEVEYRAIEMALDALWGGDDHIIEELRNNMLSTKIKSWEKLLNSPLDFAQANFTDPTKKGYLLNKDWESRWSVHIEDMIEGVPLSEDKTITEWQEYIAPILADAYSTTPGILPRYTPEQHAAAERIHTKLKLAIKKDKEYFANATAHAQHQMKSYIALQRGSAAMRAFRYVNGLEISSDQKSKVLQAYMKFYNSGLSVGFDISEDDPHVVTVDGQKCVMIRDADKKEYPIPIEANIGNNEAYAEFVSTIMETIGDISEDLAEGGKKYTAREDRYQILKALNAGTSTEGNAVSEIFRQKYGRNYHVPGSDPVKQGLAFKNADRGEMETVYRSINNTLRKNLPVGPAGSTDKNLYMNQYLSSLRVSADAICSQIDNAMDKSLMDSGEDEKYEFESSVLRQAIRDSRADVMEMNSYASTSFGPVVASYCADITAKLYRDITDIYSGKDLAQKIFRILDDAQTGIGFRVDSSLPDAVIRSNCQAKQDYLTAATWVLRGMIKGINSNYVTGANEERFKAYMESFEEEAITRGWVGVEYMKKRSQRKIGFIKKNFGELMIIKNSMDFDPHKGTDMELSMLR